MEIELLNFIADFFKNLNAKVNLENNVLRIDDVVEDFQKFYGKNEPYFFTLNEKLVSEKIELLKSSSFIVGCIKDYLKTKGQTTLINLLFNETPKEIISKNFIFKNAELSNISKKEKNEFLLRFTFQTAFQYQNQKEIENNTIFVYKNNIVKLNLEEYNYKEALKNNLEINSLRSDYDLAKNELKKLIQPKIEKLSQELDKKLEKEIYRINNHFSSREKEIETKVKTLESDIHKINNIQDKDSNILLKLEKAKKALEEIKSLGVIENLEKEKSFFINDEKHKHSLNLSNKLINTTIISYPQIFISGYLKNRDSARFIELNYNPLMEKINDFYCDSCKNQIKILTLCSSGHLICDKCSRNCSECNKEYCKVCLEKSCFSCGKKLCKRCIKKCSKCLKDKCQEHMSKLNICLSCEEKEIRTKQKLF